jgi:D-glycero-alpha-D-manno-heptose-7-phosphate kinase
MLITRTPLRISIGGGGTDLPSYYSQYGGFVISAAIDKHVYIGINRTFTDDYFLKYSALERVSNVGEIEHPIIRAALELHPVGPALEIVSLADIPAGTGLGSSGTFTVGLLRAIHSFKRNHVADQELAEEAAHIEIDVLGEPVGKQDHYIAAFGGITSFEIGRDGEVKVSPLQISNETMHDLEENLLMFFTGYSRSASSVLDEQRRLTQADDPEMVDALKHMEELGRRIRELLEHGETERFGELMHEHWLSKRKRPGGISTTEIDRWYEIAISNGALGGKLVGAGGGGFLVFYASDREKLRSALAVEKLSEVRFRFDLDGATTLVRD